MTTDVLVRSEAESQIQAIATWWQENRPAAPDLFVDELAGGLDLLQTVPDLGKRYRHRKIRGLRRLLLAQSRYHIYYVHLADRNQVIVLAVWSAVRGRQPRLRTP